jgi:TPR repeat protein
MRVSASIIADLRKVEIKTEVRRRYLFQPEVGNSDEDVVQLHEYAAAAGEPTAQVRLGEFYLLGSSGVEPSEEKAFLNFQAAARQGEPRGKSLLGFMYEKGYGVKADASEALSLYEQAAKQQDSLGLIRLGFAHLEGRLGVPVDFKQAEHHLTIASKSGSAQAWLGLGLLAKPTDVKKASKFLAVAAQKGSILAAFELAQIQISEDSQLCVTALQNLHHVFEWSTPVRRLLQRA